MINSLISIRHRFALLLALIFTLMIISMVSTATTRKITNMKNSPIFYISSPLMSRSIIKYRPQIRLPVRTTLPQTTNTLIASPYAYSHSYYKLPIQFVSNAKPIDIIKGITKTTTKKVIQSGHKIQTSKMSNLIYLPITYLSNAKPIKVMINSLGKT